MFDLIAITEARITTQISLLNNLSRNPKKAEHFQGNFYWRGQFDPLLFIFKEELIQYHYNFISLFATRKCQKIQKIDKNS